MPVINIIKNLLLLVVSTYADPLNIKILIINIVKDLLLLAINIYINFLVLVQITILREEVIKL